jgi:hypothetical protein
MTLISIFGLSWFVVVLPAGPVAGGCGVVQRAAMNASLTPLMFIVKQPCSMAE